MQAICELTEDETTVVQARIAEPLGATMPAVSEMTHRFADDGMVDVGGRSLALTAAGSSGRPQWFVGTGSPSAPWLTSRVSAAATLLETRNGGAHILTAELEAAWNRSLDHPTTCPHGTPKPGSGYTEAHSIPFAPVGTRVHIERIPPMVPSVCALTAMRSGSTPRWLNTCS